MFDKTLFDRNAFDRSVSSDGFSMTMIGTGASTYKLVFRTPVSPAFLGGSTFAPNIIFQQRTGAIVSGSGAIKNIQLVLRRNTTIPISGVGAFTPLIVVKMPISGSMYGNSSMGVGSGMYLYQNMGGAFSGIGTVDLKPVLLTDMSGIFSGRGSFLGSAIATIPLTFTLGGSGSMTLRRLSVLNENIIELIGIEFAPGDTIIIDTDLLQVLFGSKEDVSSVTSDSVFFELNPGENEITIDVDAETVLDITAVWQNRWL